jgi:hypothetical protein
MVARTDRSDFQDADAVAEHLRDLESVGVDVQSLRRIVAVATSNAMDLAYTRGIAAQKM